MLKCEDGSPLRVFELEVPSEITQLLPAKKTHIYFYELLLAAAAVFIWQDVLLGSAPVFYSDNEEATYSLLNGFASQFAPSLVLAVFWGASALHRSRPWVARVSSGANPADALTRPDLPRSHLAGGQVVPASHFTDFWSLMHSHLRSQSFPDWH